MKKEVTSEAGAEGALWQKGAIAAQSVLDEMTARFWDLYRSGVRDPSTLLDLLDDQGLMPTDECADALAGLIIAASRA